jgi:hypothetical protein
LNYLNKLIHIIIIIKTIKLMYVTPLKLNLEKYNEKYFPGQFGARYEVDKQLKIIYKNYKKRKFIQEDSTDDSNDDGNDGNKKKMI